jgi:hypothetical protein
VRPLPRYVLAIMAAFVAFELWIPLLAAILRALGGSTVPTAVQVIGSLFGLAVPTVVGLALSDYLADRKGLVRPYQPKRRPVDDHAEAVDEDEDHGFDDGDEGRLDHEAPLGDEAALGHEEDGLGHPAAERSGGPAVGLGRRGERFGAAEEGKSRAEPDAVERDAASNGRTEPPDHGALEDEGERQRNGRR